MVFANPLGHDFSGPPNLDDLGDLYITVTAVWSALLFVGIGLLLHFRKLTYIRMRNTWLMVSALFWIHVYLCLVLLVYPVNGEFPCQLEFWVMSIYLPFGMALFQAQNMQLLSLSVRQKSYMYNPKELLYARGSGPRLRFRELYTTWSSLTLTGKTYVGIVIGVIVQFIMTLVIYLCSRRFHSYGITGHPVDAAMCREGWEWIPSIFWQFFWAWGFGPYLLFRIRKIQDIHRWNLQTTLSILASLLGSPMWLAAVYSGKLHSVSKYWPAPMWFAPGLMVMEFVTLYFPLMEAYKARGFRQSTLAAIEDWEKNKTQVDVESGTLTSGSTARDSTCSTTADPRKKKNDMYSMQALEKCLELNAAELLKFAATKEFTGENIIFLTQVRDFKASWKRAVRQGLDTVKKRQLFANGCDIFAKSVSLQTAQFPVNIESKIYFALEAVFPQNIPRSPASENVATPFSDDVQLVPGSWSTKSADSVPTKSTFHVSESEEHIVDISAGDPVISPGFDEHVFDTAESSVKYMVFTNTWNRFVDSAETSTVSSEGTRSYKSSTTMFSLSK